MLFSLVTGLPSTTSAVSVSIDFVRQLRRYYTDVRLLACVHARIVLLASRADPVAGKPRIPARSLGSRACSFSTCSWLWDYAGPVRSIAIALPPVLPSRCKHTVGARIAFFRSSIPGPSMPLSTLHPAPRGTQRKTRGQDGSLLLSRGALSSSTARRFIPTIALPDGRGSVSVADPRA